MGVVELLPERGDLLDPGVQLALQGSDATTETLDEGLDWHVERFWLTAVGRHLSLRR